jgi:hypothetical protein
MAFVRLFRSRTRRRPRSRMLWCGEAPERHKPAAYLVSTVCVVYNMAEPEMGRGKHSALIFL